MVCTTLFEGNDRSPTSGDVEGEICTSLFSQTGCFDCDRNKGDCLGIGGTWLRFENKVDVK